MPTKPLPSILDRELSIAGARDFNQEACLLLKELVNYSTNAFARCDRSTTGGLDEDVAILSLFRRMIELTDGIEVLTAACCGAPAVLLVRSSFETLLSMEYILETDDQYVNRSLSWLVFFVHQKIDFLDRLDPATPKGVEFKKAVAHDEVVQALRLPLPIDIDTERSILKCLLRKPHLQAVEEEYRSKKKVGHWFQLFGGPPNLQKLSERLGRGGQYDLLYRTWSRAAHATDFSGYSLDENTGQQVVEPLRSPDDVRTAASFSSSFMLHALQIVMEKFRPGEDLKPWYVREIQQRYQLINGRTNQ